MGQNDKEVKGAEEIISKLKSALNADGDFPARARAVNELRRLADSADTPLEKIVEIILAEPALGSRILHLVNSVIYQRQYPVTTISQAVVLLGLRTLVDLCAGLVILQRFSPMACRGGVFADNLKKTMITSVLSSAFAQSIGNKDEEMAYLAGTFFSIGPLLLSYYFPQIFDLAFARAKHRRQSLTESLTESIGMPPVKLSLEIVEELYLPPLYKLVLDRAYQHYCSLAISTDGEQELSVIAEIVAESAKLADIISDSVSAEELKAKLSMETFTFLQREQFKEVLARLPELFNAYCKLVDLSFLNLPDSLMTYLSDKSGNLHADDLEEEDGGGSFARSIEEIKEAINEERSLSSIVTLIMAALFEELGFDRVILMAADPKKQLLEGHLSLGGLFDFDVKKLAKDISKETNDPLCRSFIRNEVISFGNSDLAGDKTFVVIPIRRAGSEFGVIYSDINRETSPIDIGISESQRLGIALLSELAQQALGKG